MSLPETEFAIASIAAGLALRAHRRTCAPCRLADTGLTTPCRHGSELAVAARRAERAALAAETAPRA